MKQNIESKNRFTLLWDSDFQKNAKQFSEERIVYQKITLEQLDIHMQNMSFNLNTKLTLKRIIKHKSKIQTS